MILNIILWTLFVISLAVALTLTLKKFPILASIDVTQIEAERQADLKKKILSDKFKRDITRLGNQLGKVLIPIGQFFVSLGRLIYDKLINLQEIHTEIKLENKEDAYKQIEVLLAEADDLTRKEDLAGAEHKYIEIIGIDGKNFKAYELLADNYLARDNYDEAEQTLLHVIKLKQQLMKYKRYGLSKLDLARNFFSLSLIYQKLSDNSESFKYLQQALDLEPNNPKYLDKTIEVCIMMKDSEQAAVFCRQLEESNPGNKKLKEIKDKIKDIEVAREEEKQIEN